MSDYEIIKGSLNEAETEALNQVLDGIAAEAEAARNTKPDTRGLWGKRSHTENPLGFRNPRLPRA